MATEAQIKANRENSKSAGVRTDQGKRTVRHNSFKHGMTAVTVLADIRSLKESEEEYLAIVDGLRVSLGPRNFFEEGLIEGMAKAQFKLRRFDLLEAQFFRHCENSLEICFTQKIGVDNERFGLALKYKQSLEAQYYRSLEFLYRSRQAEKQLELFLPGRGANESA